MKIITATAVIRHVMGECGKITARKQTFTTGQNVCLSVVVPTNTNTQSPVSLHLPLGQQTLSGATAEPLQISNAWGHFNLSTASFPLYYANIVSESCRTAHKPEFYQPLCRLLNQWLGNIGAATWMRTNTVPPWQTHGERWVVFCYKWGSVFVWCLLDSK